MITEALGQKKWKAELADGETGAQTGSRVEPSLQMMRHPKQVEVAGEKIESSSEEEQQDTAVMDQGVEAVLEGTGSVTQATSVDSNSSLSVAGDSAPVSPVIKEEESEDDPNDVVEEDLPAAMDTNEAEQSEFNARDLAAA